MGAKPVAGRQQVGGGGVALAEARGPREVLGGEHSTVGHPLWRGAPGPGDSRRVEALPSAQLQAELLLALTQTGLGQWRAWAAEHHARHKVCR